MQTIVTETDSKKEYELLSEIPKMNEKNLIL